MAVATSAIVSTSAVVAVPGTSVAPGIAVPDNCHTIILTNFNGGANLAYYALVAPGGNLSATGNVLLPNSQLTLKVGVLGVRGALAPLAFDCAVAGTIRITYLCQTGSMVGLT